MPKSTFIKLKKEKKEKFIKAALEEFALKEYQNASVTQIVKKLGIAKGSIYQYFENKKDLYLFLMEYAAKKKQESISEVLKQPHSDFFDLFEKMYLAGTLFDLQFPLYGAFLYNVAHQRSAKELGNLQQITKKQANEYFKKLLKTEQQKGTIRSDVAIDLQAFFAVQLGAGILDFLMLKKPFSFEKHIFEETAIELFSEEEINEYILELVELLQRGLQFKT